MNKKPYAWLDGIPDKTSDLYNDAGFINENETDLKFYEWLDLDNAEDGQILSAVVDGEAVMVTWVDMPVAKKSPVVSPDALQLTIDAECEVS